MTRFRYFALGRYPERRSTENTGSLSDMCRANKVKQSRLQKCMTLYLAADRECVKHENFHQLLRSTRAKHRSWYVLAWKSTIAKKF